MVFIDIAMFFVVVLIVVFAVMQVLIPLMRGTVLFPIFQKEVKLEKKLASVRQHKVETALEKQISEEENSIDKESNDGTK